MSNEFLNAYHFYARDGAGDYAALDPSHHLYRGHSGSIVCTLTLEQPTVIGGARFKPRENDYAYLAPFYYQELPAIPASSIKGLIASLAEAASLSAYRVLEDEKLTVRLPSNNLAEARDPTKRVTDLGTVHQYVDKQLRPLGATGRDPQTLSLAEQMFGFVIAGQKLGESAYAGHVRPEIGVLADNWANRADSELFLPALDGNDWVRLKELAQPMKDWTDPSGKPKYRSATPDFYMKAISGAASGKEAFARGKPAAGGKLAQYAIQGQKAYLHHLNSTMSDAQPFATKATVAQDRGSGAAGRKAAVCPLRRGVTFRFVLHFDNLSDAMLNLLCFAIRPSERFRHKIGYGKPLGLGSVRIDPVELVLVDRAGRYAESDVFAGRQAAPVPPGDTVQDRAERHRKWLLETHPATGTSILLIGETHDYDETGRTDHADTPPVLWVPLTTEKFKIRDTVAAEQESYQWASRNDRSPAPQRLEPIGPKTEKLPSLWTGKPPGPGGPAGRVVSTGVSGRITTRGPNQGQIATSDGATFTFGRAAVSQGAFDQLASGDHVLFDIVEDGQGHRLAINVRPDD